MNKSINKRFWENPFAKSLLEDWRLEEFPENYKEIIFCFFPPDFMNRLQSVDIKPKIIMGGRGTGKSHILRMLSVQSVINRIKIEKLDKENKNLEETKIKFLEYEEPYFGVYLKATLFSPLSTTNITYLSKDQLKSLFEHLFNMQVCIIILNAAKFLQNACEDVSKDTEEKIV
ncbi:MAG: hypothetical protein IBV52_05725 [Candidatus Bathyarchaeota archaeon]